MSTLTFSQLADRYLDSRSVTPLYAGNVRRVAARVARPDTAAINEWMRHRLTEVSSVTARSERTMLLSVWRFAYESGLIDTAPRGIMRVKARRSPTKAWTVPDLKRLVEATKAFDGRRLRTGADLGLFLRCWVLICYETGSRFGDCMAFAREHLDGDTLAWSQSKTGDPLCRPLTPACVAAINAMLEHSPNGLILGWACGKRMALRHMRQLIDSVGIGGTSKYLRRSGATHCEMAQAGAGRLHLGHRSPALFEAAYCDWSQLRTKTPRTPEIT